MPETAPTFTPFVSAVRAQPERLLRRLLGVPARTQLAWHPVQGPGEPARVAVALALPGASPLALDLASVAAGAPAWRRGEHLALTYRRSAEGPDPEVPPLSRLLARLGDRFTQQEPSVGRALLEAVAQVERFRDVEDWMYRGLAPFDGGVVGTLRLGFRCNQDCGFCWQGRRWPEPPAGCFERWLDELAAAGATSLSLTGGEPTLHPAFLGLVERATVQHGLPVEAQTNAIAFRRPEWARRAHAAGLRRLFISLHSADGAVSDRLTRAPGTHVRTLAGIGVALETGFEVALNCVVQAENVSGLVEHAALVIALARRAPLAARLEVSYTHPADAFDTTVYARSLVPLDEVRGPLLQAVDRLTDAGVAVRVSGTCGFPPCLLRGREGLMGALAVDEQAAPDTQGRVYPEDPCGECAARPGCLGVRKEYVARYGNRGLQAMAAAPGPRAPGR